MSFGEYVHTSLLGIYPGMKSLGHRLPANLALGNNAKQVSKVSHKFSNFSHSGGYKI